jgi:IS4 transposase
MQVASLHDGRWSSVVSRLSEVADLEATARRFGAFQRARKVRNAEALLGVDQQPVDVLALLPQDDQPSEHVVCVKGVKAKAPLRRVIQRRPPEPAERPRKRVVRKAGKAGHRIDPRTSVAAGYLRLITSLPAAVRPARCIVSMDRPRWQVERGFKRLKSIAGIDALPALDPDLARTWLLAHLIAAVLTDEIAIDTVGFPPSAATLPTDRCRSGVPG